MLLRSLRAAARVSAAALLIAAAGACGSPPPADALTAMREAAEDAKDGDAVGRLLLGEMFAPGGDAARAVAARKQLEALGPAAQKGLFASLARAVDDEAHGRYRASALAFLDTLAAARSSDHPDAPLAAWFATNHLLSLRSGVADLWTVARDLVKTTIEQPGKIGWRARGELVEWWSIDGYREEAQAKTGGSATVGEDRDGREGAFEAASKLYGCVDKGRIAGPFGHLAPSNHRVHFEAERAGPWPLVFPRDPLRMAPPRVRGVERFGCALRARGAPAGIYYLETFLDLPADQDVIIASQGAFAIFVDDTEVLTRDTRQWGIWPRFGARVRLEAGRHRVLARVAGPESSIRVQTPEGKPVTGISSADPAAPYSIRPPEVLSDPNALDPFLVAAGVPPQKGTPRSPARDTKNPISRMLAAYLAHVEGQDDVGGVLMTPLIADADRATGPALAMAAIFLEKDPIYPQGDARDRVKDVRARAAAKDPELWWPQFWLLLDEADKSGVPDVAQKLAALADHFREVPDIVRGLAAIYAKIGWRPEHERAVRTAAERFPDDADALRDLLVLEEQEGHHEAADKLAARIKKLDPDSEIELSRAIDRRDFRGAIRELERLGNARKDRRDIATRIADLLTRAGDAKESMAKLEAALAKKPDDAAARLALADARYARGDRSALRSALVDAIQTGSDTSALRDAIELVEGITELSPYRLDGKKVIAAYEVAKPNMPGTAARVLDYSAIWIHPDASARMLEHEILHIQSREGIQEQAEQRPRGLVLKIRTIKKDGRVFEPEIVPGKETITMPHLEIGDYIETETITTIRGDGQGGQRFEGPRWFFREEKIPYWRSEFITISPKNRKLDIETGGEVPKPDVSESGALVIHRWRVDKSPALPEEPASAPIQEFLPNVRIGWGHSLKDTIARLVDAASDETPRDPRLTRVAQQIVNGEAPDLGRKAKKPLAKGAAAPAEDKAEEKAPLGPTSSAEEKARRIYRWVVANVEPGRETDGRRVVMGKSGNRTEAFIHLCRMAGIPAEVGLVRDRLAPPPRGPMSEAETYGALAVKITTERGGRWMVVRDKFAPFGYMPSSLRGQPAVLLAKGAPEETTPQGGSEDGETHEGTVELSADGSAQLEIDQRYEGKLAILLRSALETLPAARFKETIESRLLPRSLPGARVISIDVKNLTSLDAPLVLHMKLEMSSFARPAGGELLIAPMFPLRLRALADLPQRETPLYISESLATRVTVKLRIKLPSGAHVATKLQPSKSSDGGRFARIEDRMEGGDLVLDRVMDLPAGRVLPDEYAKFQSFARHVDAALHRDVSVTLGK
jgi:cellulose synthase operon protein C